MEEIKVGDRVVWESQAGGCWKRKIGKVVRILDKQLLVEVDTVVSFDPEKWNEIGERRKLNKSKMYIPYRSVCRKVN